jgi:hypothetical protein
VGLPSDNAKRPSAPGKNQLNGLVRAIHWRRQARELVRRPPSLDEARARVRQAVISRDERFLASIEHLIWSIPASPYLPLLRHAGVERGDIIELVQTGGLEGALRTLREAGVYVAHEEWLGTEPARRGSFQARFRPAQFVNPRFDSVFLGGTGGSRTASVPIAWSFAALRRGVDPYLLRASSWGVLGTPAAIWLPVQPSAVGIATALMLAATGEPPERWFTPVRLVRRTPPKVLASNLLLPAILRSAGVRLPRPQHAPPSDPGAVLRWCRDALSRVGRARLGAYTSSAVRLAELAQVRGVSLDGLVIATLGESLGGARSEAIRASGAVPANAYGFMQKGTVAHACPQCRNDEMHLRESEVAVISRSRRRPDGRPASAFLWTSLHDETPSVLLNVENDDYGRISTDPVACGCELGALGVRQRISEVQAMTKVTAEGMTVPGEVLVRLVESVLPGAFGGSPADYQFVQRSVGREARLFLRIDPRLGEIRESAVAAAVRRELSTTPGGLLASELWNELRTFRTFRAPPEPTPSGKLLPVSINSS